MVLTKYVYWLPSYVFCNFIICSHICNWLKMKKNIGKKDQGLDSHYDVVKQRRPSAQFFLMMSAFILKKQKPDLK